jgi:threonyl-tRNA synthetase
MNCPGHVQIFNNGLRSYRDLPLRYGEFGQCHRNEPSGALHGMMRVRGFTQDDGHIFCTEEQIAAEVTAFHQQAMEVYTDFGFTNIDVKLACVRSASAPKNLGQGRRSAAFGPARLWRGVDELPGEGAFYGPKIEYHLKDAWAAHGKCGTMQVDFIMPGVWVPNTWPWTTPPGAHHAAPRDRRFAGAFHRHPDRTLRAPCRCGWRRCRCRC